jgi:ATP-dependent protease Clp ATPase subunit
MAEASLENADEMYCAFCLKQRDQVDKLVKGPAGYICSDCILACNDYLADPDYRGVQESGATCTFCGRGQEEIKVLIPGPDQNICDECVDLCCEILLVASEDSK